MRRERLKEAAVAILVLTASASVGFADELIQREVSKLKLRAETNVIGRIVTVSDLLIAAQADPRLISEISDTKVFTQVGQAARAEITHAQVVDALVEAGVNMSRVLISGSLSCRVTFEPAAKTSPPQPDAAKPTDAPGTPSTNAATLADLLDDHIAAEFVSQGGTPLVEFERGAKTFLELTSPPFDFSIRSPRRRRLGLREAHVIISRDGRVQRTVRIAANVRLAMPVLVAARPLNAGAFVRRDDLVLEQRIFERLAAVGSNDINALIGKQLKKFIPESGRITQADVKSVDLVKRSRPVTVLGGGGNISVRLTGVALDSGDMGDSVRVRIGDSRKDRRTLRGIVTGVGTVRLEGGTP
ncbi:MAG: flagellar basal body P-ring formation protein FlgA [Planctomycetes bacterium]|nr:flagellar basal body P-ring formation protein FlgA [Planctomycetota bacterium]